MPQMISRPCHSMENRAIMSLLRPPSDKPSKSAGFFRMFKLFPLLSSGCKMVALLGRPRSNLLSGDVMTATLFGHRKCRVSLAIQEDPKCAPTFVIELPIPTNALLKEMEAGLVRIALESEVRTQKKKKKKLMDETVWGVNCNGRKTGYSVRKQQSSDDVLRVMQLLHGISMGAGVLPCLPEKEAADGELTYMRARFERVIGSKDSQALYMINPDGTGGPEMSIFFLRIE